MYNFMLFKRDGSTSKTIRYDNLIAIVPKHTMDAEGTRRVALFAKCKDIDDVLLSYHEDLEEADGALRYFYREIRKWEKSSGVAARRSKAQHERNAEQLENSDDS